MPLPLILQIQQAALNSDSAVTDILRKAKVACTKLDLSEFGSWVDLELNGYMDKPVEELPKYRRLHGTPEAYNPFHGWQPIVFQTEKVATSCSFAPIGMSMPAIEESLRGKNNTGVFEFPYPPGLAGKMREAMNWETANLRIKLGVPQVVNIPHTVRNIILEWTMAMEKQGILGTDLTFNEEERAKSVAATAQTVNNIQIAQVGAFVQSAEKSSVQGGVGTTINFAESVRDFLGQMERILPTSDLPNSVREHAAEALAELRAAASAPSPDASRLRHGLESLKHIMEHATGHLVATGALALITKLLQSWPG
jgi:hypothetical protein